MGDPGKTISPVLEAVEATALKPVAEPVVVPALAGLPRLSIDEEGEGAAGSAELEISGVLGVGGMGRIELGKQRVFGREVALKRVRPDRYCAEAVTALLRESRFTGALEHPNIVPVHQLGLDAAGRPVLVMKRVEGTSWRSVVRSLTLERNLEILRQVCNAVEFAHRRGVLHRDLKLDNVMVGELGEVYVVDWGIARELSAGVPHDYAGTPAYMAPEMIEPSAPLDARTDVFLLGAMLHEVLTGRIRHEGADVQEVIARARVSAPFAYGPEVPAELAALCNRACAASPSERPVSALAFGEAVGEYVKHRGSIELAERVERRRRELDLGDVARARTLITEVTFGFRQALEVWPQNPVARAGLQAIGEAAVELEVSQKNAAGAEAALAALPEPRPQLAERVKALRAELEAAAASAAELEALKRQVDPNVGRALRPLLGGGVCLAMGVVLYVAGRAHGGLTTGLQVGIVSGLWGAFAVASSLTLRRATNVMHRNLLWGVHVTIAAALALSVLVWLTDSPVKIALAGCYLLVASFLISISVWTVRGNVVSGIAALVSAAICSLGSDTVLSAALALGFFGGTQLLRAAHLSRS